MEDNERIEKNEKNHTPRCTAVEKQKRLRNIYQWLIEGQNSVDIIDQIKRMWNIDERQAQRYVKEGREYLEELNQSEIEESRAFHKALRLDLYRSLKKQYKALEKRTDISPLHQIKGLTSLSHQINMTARDMAKIDGVFIEKVDHTSKGEQIGSGNGVFELSITTEGGYVEEPEESEEDFDNKHE